MKIVGKAEIPGGGEEEGGYPFDRRYSDKWPSIQDLH